MTPPADPKARPPTAPPPPPPIRWPTACLEGPPLSLVVQAVTRPRAATTPTTCIAILRPTIRRVVLSTINAVIWCISVCIQEQLLYPIATVYGHGHRPPHPRRIGGHRRKLELD